MTTKLQNSFFRVESRTILTVPHLDRKLAFAYPIKGPGTYTDVAKQIDDDKTPSQLYKPTTAETISLIYAAMHDKDNKSAQEILKILRNRDFWCFTKNLWVPKGVCVVNDKDGSKLVRKDLEERLQANDKDVKFVPKGFRLGEQSAEELEKNPYIIAHAGEEGAEKLAEIASEFENKPIVYGLENVTEDTEKVTDLYSGWSGYWLVFSGSCFADGRGGCAAGVQR